MSELRVDLHIHTTASDGRWSAQQLIEQVLSTGIDLFSVTDHDSIGSVLKAQELANQNGLAFLPGVEISSKLDGAVIHILAFGIDIANQPLLDFLRTNESIMHQYNDSLIVMLIDAGYALDYAEYERYTWSRSRGGWKSLNFCIDKGLCHDVHSFFSELFTGDLTIKFPDMEPPAMVIELIKGAGGIPIWAHPGGRLVHGSNEWNKDLIARMIDFGLCGLECFTSQHDATQTKLCLACARENGLLVTGGSDSHGGFAGRTLGNPVVNLVDLDLGPIMERIEGLDSIRK
ncbi:MAG: PHP domain-containing protein [Anaerolineales bacterium]|nr:PHP domain-containing protein [Anaerolineales bacterium]